MFCNQCEQTSKGIACTEYGVCGKNPQVAALQDLLVHAVQGLSHYAVAARAAGVVDARVNRFTAKALFSTLTNVNFDPDRFVEMIREAAALRDSLEAHAGKTSFSDPAASFTPAADRDGMTAQGEAVGLPVSKTVSDDIRSLQEVTLYGMKGVAAYADHAAILGKEDDAVYGFLHSTLAKLADDSLGLDAWVALALDCGRINIRAMELLDAGHTETFGHPVPTPVELGNRAGKAILISGHDLRDLDTLLRQTRDKGIDVYTHGEMLPAHGYPGLKKYPHLAGHFGTAWQNQKKEFEDFPGAILFTTNCLMPPKDTYKDRVFTTGVVGFPGLRQVPNDDFSAVIEKALACEGYAANSDKGSVTAGFARNAVLGVADKVIEAVKAGAIRRFFLVGGCDGAKAGRNYYTEFVEKTPPDTVVLTLACGKFRFFDKKLGDIGGIPRLLDVGQCNDAYSAVAIATALAKAFDCTVNDLPLSIICSWYEQKAVAILLSLLHLGIRNIRLGPSLPAFVTPNVLQVLVDNFAIQPIGGSAEADLSAILG